MLCQWLEEEEDDPEWTSNELHPEMHKVDYVALEMLSEELPTLAVLELQLREYTSLQPPDSSAARVTAGKQTSRLLSSAKRARLHFDEELIRSIVQSEAQGMQLLQIECGLGQDHAGSMYLPPTLRYLSAPCRSVHAMLVLLVSLPACIWMIWRVGSCCRMSC